MTKPIRQLITDRQLDWLHEHYDEPAPEIQDADLPTYEVRTAFISDLHLGRTDSKVEKLSIFLDRIRLTNKIVVNGDAIDYWLFRGSRPQHLGRIFKDDTYLRSSMKFLQFGLHLAFRQVGWNVCVPSGDETMRWQASHNLPIQKLLRIIRKVAGIFVPGNHDELFRGFTNELHEMGGEAAEFMRGGESAADPELHQAYLKSPSLGGLDVLEEFVYETKHGQHLHVCHGDRFDEPHKKSSALGMLATLAYHGGVAPVMRALWMKDKEKRLTSYVNSGHTTKDVQAYYDRYADFLDKYNEEARIYNTENPDKPPREILRGGIHGHLHNPGIRQHRGYVFMDSGDFVDDKHCTSLVEHNNGTWQIMTVDREKGIHAHPVTPEPVDLLPRRGPLLYANKIPLVGVPQR